MRAIHEHDCDFEIIGICTCGALNKCRRLGAGSNVPGMAEHEANIKKLRDLQRLERDARDLGRVSTDPAAPTGGEANPNV